MPRSSKKIAVATTSVAPARFQVLSDDVALDTTTQLQWTRAESVTPSSVTWAQAKKACDTLDLGGHKDWRLPTRVELLTLVDDTRFDPAIDPAFNCKSDWYWAGTRAQPSPGVCAWVVLFSSGGFSCRYFQGYFGWVRAVRSGQY